MHVRLYPVKRDQKENRRVNRTSEVRPSQLLSRHLILSYLPKRF